jgi:hypothetical protein
MRKAVKINGSNIAELGGDRANSAQEHHLELFPVTKGCILV